MIKAKSLKSVLVIPNITFQKDLEADSFVKVMREIIIGLDKFSPLNLWFHIPLPKYSKLLDLPNVTQYFIEFPSYPNSMRAHFNYYDWMKIIDWKNQDFDLIYSHLPEQTLNVTNIISNTTNIGTLPIVGYCHWFEIKEITEYDKNFLLNNINGILEMEECGVNTQSQIDMVIDNVKDIYSEQTLSRLKEIMKPHYLGVQSEDVVDKPSDYEKIIVFNHRPQAYKDFPNFMKVMDELWKQRQDFKVWIPLLEKSDLPYVITDKFDKKGYYDFLKKCCVGFAPKQKYAGWSVSVTDGIMNGCPYIFYEADYYKELIGEESEFFKSNEEAIELLNFVLDNKEERQKIARHQLEYCKQNMTWEKRIPVISNMITKALDTTKPIVKGERKDDIIAFIKKNKQVTKSQILKHMGWGVGIKFANYRKFVMNNPNVVTKKFTETLFDGNYHNKQGEYYVWEENDNHKILTKELSKKLIIRQVVIGNNHSGKTYFLKNVFIPQLKNYFVIDMRNEYENIPSENKYVVDNTLGFEKTRQNITYAIKNNLSKVIIIEDTMAIDPRMNWLFSILPDNYIMVFHSMGHLIGIIQYFDIVWNFGTIDKSYGMLERHSHKFVSMSKNV